MVGRSHHHQRPAAEATAADAALERLWPQLSAQAFVQDLLGSRNRLAEAAGDDFTAANIGRLYRQSADRLADERWSDSDIALPDEAGFLLHGSAQTSSAGRINTTINVLTAERSKGLEFDAVVILEPAEIADSNLRLPNLALTRATRYLSLARAAPHPSPTSKSAW